MYVQFPLPYREVLHFEGFGEAVWNEVHGFRRPVVALVEIDVKPLRVPFAGRERGFVGLHEVEEVERFWGKDETGESLVEGKFVFHGNESRKNSPGTRPLSARMGLINPRTLSSEP